MWDRKPAWKEAIDYRNTIRAMLIGLPLLAILPGWAWFAGYTERAVYLGPSPGFSGSSEARLRTQPDANWVMERNNNYHALKVGCRYDFSYEPNFGRRRAQFPERHVRKATLVDCPAAR